MKSDSLKIGTQNAPHRALYHALGLTEEEIERPLVGIVSSYNEIVPGHMNIDKIVDAVKIGVAMAGGTPIVFPAIAVCDGIAMGHTGMKYSLVTRDLIADSTEAMALAHGFDALVMVPNCDKNVPGLLMAAGRPRPGVRGGLPWRQPYAAVFVRLTNLCAMAATSLWPSCPIFPPMTSPVACVRYPMPFVPRLFRAMST